MFLFSGLFFMYNFYFIYYYYYYYYYYYNLDGLLILNSQIIIKKNI